MGVAGPQGRERAPREAIDSKTGVICWELQQSRPLRSCCSIRRLQSWRADVQAFDMSVLLVPEEPRMPRLRPADTILDRVVIALLPKEQR